MNNFAIAYINLDKNWLLLSFLCGPEVITINSDHYNSNNGLLIKQLLQKEGPGVDPTKLFFLRFFFFSVKLGYFTINNFFSLCNKNASLPAKSGEFLR